jgi:hypothetical protein
MVESVFLLSVVTIASGIIGLCIRYLFKCKCNEFSLCCGLINVHRDIESEKEIASFEFAQGTSEEDEQQQRDPEDTTGI